MHADTTPVEDQEHHEHGSSCETEAYAARTSHSLLDVLMPATPPQPKNARVVRLFDYDGPRSDTRTVGPAKPVQPREQTAREAEKVARKSSLLTAAGLG